MRWRWRLGVSSLASLHSLQFLHTQKEVTENKHTHTHTHTHTFIVSMCVCVPSYLEVKGIYDVHQYIFSCKESIC